MCILTRIARRPPRQQWQCQGRNGTSSVTAFARGSPRDHVPTPGRPSTGRPGRRGRGGPSTAGALAQNRRRDRIYVTRRAFGRDCTSASRPPSLSPPPLPLSRSLPHLPRILRFTRAPRPHPFRDERERVRARARYASRASSCGSLTGTWWNERSSNEKSETAIRPPGSLSFSLGRRD